MKKRHTRKKKLISQAGRFAAPISEPKFSMPPLSPIDSELSMLAFEVRRGGQSAAKARVRLNEIKARCEAIIAQLPKERNKKKPNPRTPSNALAKHLYSKIRQIRAGKLVCRDEGLQNEIMNLKEPSVIGGRYPFDWWGSAKKIATISDPKVIHLIRKIGAREGDQAMQDYKEKILNAGARIPTPEEWAAMGKILINQAAFDAVNALRAKVSKRMMNEALRLTREAVKRLQ